MLDVSTKQARARFYGSAEWKAKRKEILERDNFECQNCKDDAFTNNNIIFGDNPLMRWYANNVLVKTNADGNKHYLKKEEVCRKTDDFKCFVCGMWCAKELEEQFDIDDSFDMLDEIEF